MQVSITLRRIIAFYAKTKKTTTTDFAAHKNPDEKHVGICFFGFF